MKLNIKRRALSLFTVICLIALFAFSASAYHFRGYFSRNVGYANQPAYSDDLYKVGSQGKWAVSCIANSKSANMKYEIVNSNGDQRGLGITSSSTFGPTELNCTGETGHVYRLKVSKTGSNPLAAYPIEAYWDTDANP